MLVHCMLSIINEILLWYLANVTLLLYCSVTLGGNRYSIFTFGRDYFKIFRYIKQLRYTCFIYIWIYRKKLTKLTSCALFSKSICRTHVQICYSLILHILSNVSIFFLSIYVPWKEETKHVMIPWYVPFAFRDTSKKPFLLDI